MFSTTMSGEVKQEKGRLKSLPNSDVKKKIVNNKWRRLCSVDKCHKLAQRKSLCARHLAKKKCQEKSSASIALSCAVDPEATSQNTTNSVLLTENYIQQNIFDGYGELSLLIN
jgi:hypothetical protein